MSTRLSKFASKGGVSLLLMGIPATAQAQTASSTPGSTSAAATGPMAGPVPDAQTAGATAPAVGEIIVTAQKRSTSLQKVAATVSVVSGEVLQKLEVRSFERLNALVPGFNFERTAGGNSVVAIRGVGTTSAGQSLEQSVAAYINGVYMGGNIREFSTPLYDIGQVEILKGTQSGISGQNTSVGAMNIVTRMPGNAFGSYVRAGHEFRFDGWNAEGGIDLPVSDALKVRVSGLYDDVGGWVKNLATGKRTGGSTIYSGRLNVVWKAADTVTVKLYGQYDHGKSLVNALIPFGNPISALYGSFIPGLSADNSTTNEFTSHGEGGDSFYRYNNLRGSMTVDVDLGGPVLTSITAASRINDRLGLDIDHTPIDFLALTQDSKYHQVHQELRIVSPSSNRVTYILGAWFRHSKQDKAIRYYTDQAPFPIAIPFPPFVIPPFTPLGGLAEIPFKQVTDTFSLFGDLHYKVTNQFVIGGTLRYTNEKKRGQMAVIANPASGFTPYPLTSGKLTPKFFDGSATIQYSPTNTLNLYALYAHGTKTGAFIDQTPVLTSLRPEKTNTFEVGAKLRVPPAALTLNLSAFRMNVKDYQDVFAVIEGALRFVPQNRDLYTQGLEFQSSWQPVTGLTLGVASLVLHSREKGTGEDAARSPKFTVSGNARYETPLNGDWKGAIFANANHSSSYVNTVRRLSPFFTPTGATTDPNYTRTPPYTMIDLGAEVFQDKGLSAKFVVQNITNKHAYAAVDVLPLDATAHQGALLPLRRMVLTLGYNF